MDLRDEVPYEDFGRRLAELRRAEKLTRAELGEICGIAASTVANYEKGLRIPYADTAVRMADHFRISVRELLGMAHPELAMAQEEGLDRAREISGKKGADRLRAVYREAAHLAGGDLTDEQLLEFSLEMTKMAQLAQQKLTERYAGRRFEASVRAKAEKTAESVRALDDEIQELASGPRS